MKLPEGVSEIAYDNTLAVDLLVFDPSHLSDDDMADIIKEILRDDDMGLLKLFAVGNTPKMRALLGKGMDQ